MTRKSSNECRSKEADARSSPARADDLYLRPGASGVSARAPPPRLPAPALVSGHGPFEVAPLRHAQGEAADTAGAAWAHMAAPELTPALKRELQIVRMRGALDPSASTSRRT